MEQQTPARTPESSFRGLYKHVKISVKTLDMVIIGGIILGIVLVLYGVANNGYVVTFDSKGGTDVPPQNQMYGQLLEEPEAPSREGYIFNGWYKDHACDLLWDLETDIIESDITLYAGWQAKS